MMHEPQEVSQKTLQNSSKSIHIAFMMQVLINEGRKTGWQQIPKSTGYVFIINFPKPTHSLRL